ncbi:small-conductance mechanosensitive channel [Alteribacter lacisalsi]|uniref:Small-conductance mechanosensitive channel n=1 Tax=Alteribacter lacisalsi TaxID=2045244 RepID=A0A2W0H4N0_9BACI|nr:small-conductance mechanosensitive channel [Alteribacter lacisalsi]PYZ95981.1 small-conductance mechanosensitive channel [Alteribacter lacisalsi]
MRAAETGTETPVKSNGLEVFHSKAHYWGRLTLWMLIAMCLVVPLYVSFVLGAHPGWNVILVGLIGYASFIGIMWVLEPITYYPALGIGGTYLAFLTGNIANMCLPCSSAAQKAVGAEVGTRKAEIAGVIGIAIASLVNITIIVVIIFAGTAILGALPAAVHEAFDFILPAIFGAVLGQFAYKTPKYGIAALLVGMAVLFAPIFDLIKIPLTVALTIALILFMEKQKNKKAAD